MIKVDRGYNMGIKRLSLSAWSQIIDVTDQCTFEWDKKPEPCKAYLEVSSATGDFTEGETIQGQSSGATAVVFSSYVNGNRVYVENVSGTFQEGETIQGQSSGQTAIVDGFVPERSYPNNITHGTFPDSIISLDEDDYLEYESTSTGWSVIASLLVKLPTDYIFSPIISAGTGQKVDSLICYRRIETVIFQKNNYWGTGPQIWGNLSSDDISFEHKFGMFYGGLFKGQLLKLYFRVGDKGTYRFRIHNIRILRFLV